MPASTCQKIRVALLGNKNHLGHQHSADARKKMGLASLGKQYHLGHKHSDKAKQIIGLRSRQYFETHPSPMKGKRHSPGSREKMRAHWDQVEYRLAHSGPQSQWYRGGRPKGPYHPDWKSTRQKILARDNYTCRIPSCHNAQANQVHHIDYNSTHDNPGNLITLCQCHHSQSTTGDRVAWQLFLEDLQINIRSKNANHIYPN